MLETHVNLPGLSASCSLANCSGKGVERTRPDAGPFMSSSVLLPTAAERPVQIHYRHQFLALQTC